MEQKGNFNFPRAAIIIILTFSDEVKVNGIMVKDAVIVVILFGAGAEAGSMLDSEYELNVGNSSRSIFDYLVRSVLQHVYLSAQNFSDLLSDHHHHLVILQRIVKREY